MSDSAIRRSSKRSRKRLRTKANLLARDAQVFLTSCDFDIPVARDAEKLVNSAVISSGSLFRLISLRNYRKNQMMTLNYDRVGW